VKSRLPGNPQPVPPIFQPEVAADAIYWAAHHRRRELWVGGSTTVAMVGQKIAPGFADWYLGKTGVDSQQTDQPTRRDPRPNLWEPLPGDHGAHGSFDSRASDYSVELWASKNKPWLWLGALSLGVAGALGAAKMRDARVRAHKSRSSRPLDLTPGSSRLDDQRSGSKKLNAEKFDTPNIQAG
jgi:hypothetical protein